LRRTEPTLDIDELAETLQGKLEGVKLGDVTDAAFKTGVWVSCVMGTKFLTDLVLDDELLAWAGDNPRMLDSMLKSYVTMSLTGGFWPADITRIFKDYLADPLTDAEIQSLVDGYNNQGFLANKRVPLWNPALLVKLVLMDHAELRTIMEANARRVEDKASQVDQIQARMDKLESEILVILESGEKAGVGSRQAEIDRLKIQLADAQAAAQLELDAEVNLKEAKAKSINILRWCIALTIGTYLAGSMVYAGDTLLDSIQGVFNMFKLPFKGGV